MVAPPADQAQQQQPPADSLLKAQGDLEQRDKVDADTPAAEEKKDDSMGDKGGKRSAEEAECFPEIGQAEDEAGQPNAKKPAAAKTVCTSTTPENDSLLKAQGDLERREEPMEATVQQTVQATLAVQAIIGKTSKRGNSSSSSSSSSSANGTAEPRG